MVQISSSIQPEVRLDVRGLLRALDDGWQAYLLALEDLSASDRTAYLAAQGFVQRRDLLAHVTAWEEETLGIVALLLRDGTRQLDIAYPAERRYDDDQAFNAQAVARFSAFSCAEVERRFIQANAALARMLALLPDNALAHPAIYHWLHTTVVDHFNEHRPPNLPALP
jgi:hypothetical protein